MRYIFLIVSIFILVGFSSNIFAAENTVMFPIVVKGECECPGTNIGDEAFKLVNAGNLYMKIGDVFHTSIGKLIVIVGITSPSGVSYNSQNGIGFYVTLNTLPVPPYGRKGKFYYTTQGNIAYADYL